MKYLNDVIRVSQYYISLCKHDESKLRDLVTVYFNVFGESLKTSCGNCIGDGIIRLKLELKKYNLNNNLKQKIMTEERRKYVMKPGSVIDFAYSTGEYITPDNITDNKARKLIKRNPAYLKWFVKYPKDEVAKLIGEEESEKEKPPEEEGVASGKVTLVKDDELEITEKKVATKADIDKLVRDNSKDALLEKSKDIPGVNAEMDKATLAKMILEA